MELQLLHCSRIYELFMENLVRFSIGISLAILMAGVLPAGAQGELSLEQAIRHAVTTNPRIKEAAANRRATDMEVRQVQGALLPQVRLQAEYGSERSRRFDGVRAAGANDPRKAGGEASVVVTQLLYDGFATVNQIYRQIARSDAAAWRTFERSELVALDTVEAYLDILRYSHSIAHANANISAHEVLSNNVSQRFAGGRAGRGDAEQVRERLNSARAVKADLQIRLDEARAAFRRSVGLEPRRLGPAKRLSGLPRSRQEALDKTLAANPSLRAASSDVTAAEREFDASSGAFGPRVSLEGRARTGRDSGFIAGGFDEASAKVRMDWNIFSGGTDSARRNELAERIYENRFRMDALRRSAFESVDRAWGAREHSGARINALMGQVTAAQQVVQAYRGEYELGQRTLLDLLNAENAMFNAKLSLEAARVVAVFSDYQLLATSGQLLSQLRINRPADAALRTDAQRGALSGLNVQLPRGAVE
ncbi:MAG: TolC family outer membrane protein [Rhizobiales bacterium]|nr:TolC family outer membrane protein [Hyphomicrobiales bacterium]